MEVSKKLDYALRMLAEVVHAPEGEVVSVRSVAESNGIPYSFARTIQHEMVRAGLLSTTRGPHGGMTLAVDAAEVTLLDIVQAIGGPVRNLERSRTNKSSMFNPIWDEVELLAWKCLSAVTLQQVVVDGLAPAAREGFSFEAVPVAELVSELEALE